MKVYIRNMVCQGTRKFVLMELRKMGLNINSFENDEIEFQRELSSEEAHQLIKALGKYGLSVIHEKTNHQKKEVRIGYYPPETRINVKEYKEAALQHVS
ncbi:MAG TPA: hypothetical protein VHO68_02080 [Bacteroidales bacterium]|nr:hypothetical protein [Bacteroidales bacterium]